MTVPLIRIRSKAGTCVQHPEVLILQSRSADSIPLTPSYPLQPLLPAFSFLPASFSPTELWHTLGSLEFIIFSSLGVLIVGMIQWESMAKNYKEGSNGKEKNPLWVFIGKSGFVSPIFKLGIIFGSMYYIFRAFKVISPAFSF